MNQHKPIAPQPAAVPANYFILMMACLTGLTALGIDAVLPIFPEMIAYYQLPAAEHNRIQQVVYVYMLGFSIFQLFFGVLADTVGRKPLLFIGITVYACAALSVLFLKDFDQVLWARFIQGAGLAAPRVLTMTIVRDVSEGREMSRIVSFITMVFLAVPAIAPMLGQLIVLFAPWQGVFLLLFLLGVGLMIWVQRGLTETLPPENRRPLSLHQLKTASQAFFSHRETVIYLLMISLQFSGLMMYVGQAEQILQKDIYQLGHLFPFAFATIILGLIAASVTNAKNVMRVGVKNILRIGLITVWVADVIFFILVMASDGVIPLWLFIALISMHFFGFGLTMPNLNTLALAPYRHIAGTASALIGTFTSVVGVAIAHFVSHFYNGTLMVIASGLLFCSVALFAIYVILKRIVTDENEGCA